jgi:hypothetical protein
MTYIPKFDADEFIGLICDAQRLYTNDYQQKKRYVLYELRVDLGAELYERYLPVLDVMIDMIKAIAKDQNVVFSSLLLQKRKRKWFSCFNF